MPEVSVEVEVYCAKCGDGLCDQTESTTGFSRGEPQFRVDPCRRCLDEAREEGKSGGYDGGSSEAEEENEEPPEKSNSHSPTNAVVTGSTF